MTNGSSQGLFVVVAIVIFGIFVFISYLLFKDNMQPSLAKIFCDSFTSTSKNTGFGKLGNCGVDSGNDSEINTDDLLETQEVQGYISLMGTGLASIKDKSNDLTMDIVGAIVFGKDYGAVDPYGKILNQIDSINQNDSTNPTDEYTIYSLNNLYAADIKVKDSGSGKYLGKNEFKVLLNGKEIEVLEYEDGLGLNTSEILTNLKFKGYSENPNLEFIKGDMLDQYTSDIDKGGYHYKTSDIITIFTKNEKIEIPLQIILASNRLS